LQYYTRWIVWGLSRLAGTQQLNKLSAPKAN
jgi:hypothetical protein